MKKVVIYCDGAARNNGKDNNIGVLGQFFDMVTTLKPLRQASET